MDVVSERAHRTLAYISLVNAGGQRPSRTSVEEFYGSATPRRTNVMTSLSMALTEYALGTTTESPVEYLARMEWVGIDRQDGVYLTPVGQALIRALDLAERDAEPVLETVLDVDDPFAYARAILHLRTGSPALLVDPHLRLPQLIDLNAASNIERVLVGSKLSANDLADLARGARVISDARTFELRKATNVHDRYLIPDNGSVRMLGGSLNTVGHAPIAICNLSDDLSAHVRQIYEQMWATAEPVTLPEREETTDKGTTATKKPPRKSESAGEG